MILGQAARFNRYRSRRRCLPFGILTVSRSSHAARPLTTQFLPSVMALTATRFVDQFKTTYGEFSNRVTVESIRSEILKGSFAQLYSTNALILSFQFDSDQVS